MILLAPRSQNPIYERPCLRNSIARSYGQPPTEGTESQPPSSPYTRLAPSELPSKFILVPKVQALETHIAEKLQFRGEGWVVDMDNTQHTLLEGGFTFRSSPTHPRP
jgi:hypothetical protein